MLKGIKNLTKNIKSNKGTDMSVIFFSLFSAWLLAVPFMGQVLAERMINLGILFSPTQNIISVLAQFTGLWLGGLLMKTISDARRLIMVLLGVCAISTVIFLLPYSILWDIGLIISLMAGGIIIAGWGFFFQQYESSTEKLQVAGSVIIYSNIGMIFLNITAVNVSAQLSLTLSLIMLILSFVCCYNCPTKDKLVRNQNRKIRDLKPTADFKKSIILLYIFVTIITIDSGIMYQIVKPAFSHLEVLTSIYWAIPYIVAILIVKNLPERISKFYILYIAVTMIGLSYIMFFALNRSAVSYILIDTVMLGAFGICDLFWWAILGDMLALTNKPARIFGIGLSANVLGVLLGMGISYFLTVINTGPLNYTHISIGIVFLSLIILPMLYINLSKLIKGQAFLMGLIQYGESEEKSTGESSAGDSSADEKPEDVYMDAMGFTGREKEIAKLLMAGRTYKMISQELFISENTVKTHIKNIYTKSHVSNKAEFVTKITHITRFG